MGGWEGEVFVSFSPRGYSGFSYCGLFWVWEEREWVWGVFVCWFARM